MSNAMFLLVVGILALHVWLGTRNGLVKTVFSLFSAVVVLILTSFFAPKISEHLQNQTKFFDGVAGRIERSLETDRNKGNEKETESMPSKKRKGKKKKKSVEEYKKDKSAKPNGLIRGEGIYGDFVEEIFKEDPLRFYKENIQKEVNRRFSRYLAGVAINAGAFFGLYLVLRLVMFVVEAMLNLLSKFPILSTFNRIGGGAAGLLKGIVVVWLMFTLMTVFMHSEVVQEGLRQVEENSFLNTLYRYNIISRVIGI